MIVTSKEVTKNYINNKNYNELNMLAYKNNICIEILDDEGLKYSSGASNSCILLDSKIIKKNKEKFISGDDRTVNFTAYNYNYNDELLIYGEKLSDGSIIFISTPLTLIKANAEMVHDLTYANAEKRNKNLDVIIKETDRLNMLVEDILDLSKAQSKTMKLDLKRLNLVELVKTILTRYEVLKEKNGYNIIFNSDKEFVIKADRKRLEQVIYNLINNAINYTGKDKLVTVNLVDKKNKVRFEVIDTGKGINKEDINYIWDKYYKADKSYHRVTVGTGLGLSIVKNILEMHNFKYGVETSKKGTKFYFEAPKE